MLSPYCVIRQDLSLESYIVVNEKKPDAKALENISLKLGFIDINRSILAKIPYLLYYYSMKKRIPYAVSNLEEIVEDNYFFVDKTSYLELMELYKVPVFLRPRRFGKTMWCSVLECYYDIKRAGAFEKLFGPLYIGSHPTPLKNSYLILRLNFSKIEVNSDIARLEANFNRSVNLDIKLFLSRYAEYFGDALSFSPEASASDHLAAIQESVIEKNLPPMYIIIDEYDNFTNQLITTRQERLYYDLTGRREEGDSFFRTFFKIIKTGIESRAVGRVFITGVLPVTIDDLTSGFNIAEIVTLEPTLHDMMGFTQDEVDDYVNEVFDVYGFDKQVMPEILSLLRNYYNGYCFVLEGINKLYNSTILTYFLKSFTINKAQIPQNMIDANLKTDLSWLRRLTEKEEQTIELVSTLISRGTLPYNNNELAEKFNMARFFDPNFYSASLFFLGMVTRENDFRMVFPNQTVKQIFAGYYSELVGISGPDRYVPFFEQFIKEGDLEKLFSGYWETYIAQIPAQAFDKMNENFFRISFFELCNRYLGSHFTFAIEANYPSGRSDWEMIGRRNSGFDRRRYLVEFKYHTTGEAQREKILSRTEAREEELRQIKAYEADILTLSPDYRITKAVIYIGGNRGYKYFPVE